MNRLLLLLIIFITLTNISYASFPIIDTLKVNQDRLHTEEVKKYHDHLVKMGIDLNSCKCESCRNNITAVESKREANLSSPFKRILLPIIITLVILSAIFIIILYRYVDKTSGATGLG